MMVDYIKLKKGEGRAIPFTIKQDSVAFDVSGATITFKVKYKKSDTTAIITKSDSDIDKTESTNGIINITLNTTDTNITPKSYIAELEFEWTINSDYKSIDIPFYIEESVN